MEEQTYRLVVPARQRQLEEERQRLAQEQALAAARKQQEAPPQDHARPAAQRRRPARFPRSASTRSVHPSATTSTRA